MTTIAPTDTATCTICGRENCKVREQFTQETARFDQPRLGPKSLGFYGYCPDCACSFTAPTPQTSLSL